MCSLRKRSGVGAMATVSNQRVSTPKRVSLLALLLLVIFSLLVVACFAVVYFVGDLTRYQEAISARETQNALRGVNDPEQLDQALKQFPANDTLKLIALANKESIEIDAAAQKRLDDAEPKELSKPVDLTAADLSDLDALRRDLQNAGSNAASLGPDVAAFIKAERDKAETDAHLLKVGSSKIAKFMAMIDEQDTEVSALTSRILAARAEYYDAYEKCVGYLTKEFGLYKVQDGQFVFPFQFDADGYNRVAAAMEAAVNGVAQLEQERAALRQSQLNRWKSFAGR